MRRGELFWGPLLVLLGLLFFLKAAGFIAGDVFSWFWPLLIIAVGVWILIGGWRIRSHHYDSAEKFSVPLEGAREASLTIDHGMGQISLHSGAAAGDFLTGVSGVGMDRKSRLNDGKLEVKIDAGPSFIPFVGPDGGVWEYRLNPDIPVSIKLDSGASRLDIDLTDLRVTHFTFDGGASNLNLTLPAHMASSLIDIDAGAASLNIRVPDGVALRLRTRGEGSSLHIDSQRFPMRESDLYQSANYDTAQYHAEVSIHGGASSVTVS